MDDTLSNSNIVIYKSDKSDISVRVEGETVWLTQLQMAELFQSSKSNVSEHIKHIFEEGELIKDSVVRKFRTTALDGKSYSMEHYNLDMIISLGYRVKSSRATQFRIWATQKLKEFLVKGFVMDDERLKEDSGGSYWKELLDRIKDIRSSEKVLYRQVVDLYATSSDYDPKSLETMQFFSIVQNKLHYAANGRTAAELVNERVDFEKPFMGLMTFGENGVRKKDVVIAKNYLDEKEIKRLNNIVSAYFDIAELRAIDEIETTMEDYLKQLDKLILSMDRAVLKDGGSVSKIEAERKAYGEYRKYQTNTLSPTEKEYMDSLKLIEKKIVGSI